MYFVKVNIDFVQSNFIRVNSEIKMEYEGDLVLVNV